MARSEQVADYMADLARHFQAKGFERLDVFLDQNPSHKSKMQGFFVQKTADLTIQTTFHYIAPYSPKMNLVEFAIHLIRLKILHHADNKTPLPEFEYLVKNLCENGKILNQNQIINILEHIQEGLPNLRT